MLDAFHVNTHFEYMLHFEFNSGSASALFLFDKSRTTRVMIMAIVRQIATGSIHIYEGPARNPEERNKNIFIIRNPELGCIVSVTPNAMFDRTSILGLVYYNSQTEVKEIKYNILNKNKSMENNS